MKIFFWIMWVVILLAELYVIRSIIDLIISKNPTSLTGIIVTMIIGGALLGSSYYLYQDGKTKWACLVTGLPLAGIFLFFFFFIILPVLMGERMN